MAKESEAKGSTWEKYQRNLASYHKNHLFATFGGVLWTTLLACLGYIDEEVVRTVNSFVTQRVTKEGRDPQTEGRAQAATQGEKVPSVRGVFHELSEGKMARDAAKAADGESQSHDKAWWAKFHEGKTRPGDWWEVKSLRLAV